MDKLGRIYSLGELRRKTRYQGYGAIGDYHDGAYETSFVSPYTKAASNVDASILLLLQDWASDEWLRGPLNLETQRLGYTPGFPTNVALTALLRDHFQLGLGEAFATNLFPFVKHGGISSYIRVADLVAAAKQFAIPQVEIVQPILAICLGLATFNAMRRAAGLAVVRNLDTGIGSPFRLGSTEAWCQSHPGALGRINRNRGGVDRVFSDWQAMARAYNKRLLRTGPEAPGPPR